MYNGYHGWLAGYNGYKWEYILRTVWPLYKIALALFLGWKQQRLDKYQLQSGKYIGIMRDAKVFRSSGKFYLQSFFNSTKCPFSFEKLWRVKQCHKNSLVISIIMCESHLILFMNSVWNQCFSKDIIMNSLFRSVVVTFGKWSLKVEILSSWLLHNHEAMTTHCLQTAKWFPIGHQPRDFPSSFIEVWILQTHSSFLVWQETE